MAQINGKETRERILDSAEAAFADDGFGGARISRIAKRAGVTGAMVHYYFGTKEVLHRAVLDRMVADLLELVAGIAPKPIDPVEKLQRFFLGFFDYNARHRNFSRLTSMETGHDNRDYFLNLVRTYFRPQYDLARDFFLRGMAAGVFRQVDPDHLLTAIWGMITAYFSDSPFLEVLIGETVMKRDLVRKRREMLMDMILRMLLRDPDSAGLPVLDAPPPRKKKK
ncbi:MAG: TetR/AcrR family transcriptional regulator [Myxococcales bacterium]|nr:MAG: TetR/AcrR family transcriptional regulator [Myxococcales bacterium]